MQQTILPSLLIATLFLSACANTMDRLEQIGKAPPLKEVQNPHTQPNYKPVSWPMPAAEPASKQYANTLWQPGSRSFFRDQRAGRVGDILRVKVEINDKAEVDNESKRERSANESVQVPSLAGSLRGKIIPGASDSDLFGLTGATTNEGTGEIAREEKINTQVAAIVTQVLPNGNLVIEGSQEIRVNFEVRELSVKGVVRPEDIGSDNTIDLTQIAEARVNYGGRGQISDVQQPRWGHQVIDVISPF